MLSDSRVAAGRLAGAQANAMENAASNEAGAFTGFLGMGMANAAGGQGANMYSGMQQQEDNPFFMKKEPASSKPTWTCACGAVNSGNFCSECGKPKPQEEGWTCACGAVNSGNFCSECGKPKPTKGFVCSNEACGYTSDENMKFCPECGSPNKNK